MIFCSFCHNKITNPEKERCWRGVIGWEEYKRKAGGTNAVVGRKPQDLWCCLDCVRKIKRGIDPSQPALL